jgi:calcineurin-like phosphoesterase family protein
MEIKRVDTYICTDWHLGHENILKYRFGFQDIKQHDSSLIENYKIWVKPQDVVYFLGDMVFNRSSLDKIGDLPGTKYLIMGNHDQIPAKYLLEVFDDIRGPMKFRGAWFTHHPIHPQEMYGKINIHGHTHNQSILDGENSIDGRYYNACPEMHGYRPVNLEEIFNKMRKRGVYK